MQQNKEKYISVYSKLEFKIFWKLNTFKIHISDLLLDFIFLKFFFLALAR